jgi:hypothetical protein
VTEHIDAGLRRRAPRAGTSVAAIIALAALAAGALTVAFLLPRYIAPLRERPLLEPPAQSGPVATPAPAPAAPPTAAARPGPEQAEAEKLLADALRRIAKLEGEGARVWGSVVLDGVSLAGAEESLGKANGLYDRHKYGDSLPLLREAILGLDRLAESKAERLRLAMTAGQQALAALDAATARAQFEIAAALAPGDAAAARLLERARRLPDVLARMAQGQSAEAAGNLAAARDSYHSAGALDGEFAPARESLVRVEREIAAREYRAAVSEAHARLGEGNLRATQSALDRARRLHPNAPELAEISQRLQAALRLAALERVRVQVAGLERQEKWLDALEAYDQALAVDANAAFARTGRARAQQLAELHAALDLYIAAPTRLQSADPRSQAKALVAQAGNEAGPVLSAKRQQLAQLIAAAEAPVPVLLHSDRNTEVTLQRVGKLGTFDTRRVELPPGRYLAIGSRDGYRDVRVPFEVPRSEPVAVQATERIR